MKTGSYYWYIVPVTGGFQLVNRLNTGLALTNYGYPQSGTTNCGADYIDRGNVWILEDQYNLSPITISYYYDKAYHTRYSTAGVANLAAYQEQIGTILTNVFGVNIALVEPGDTPMTSFGDECVSGINEYCTEDTCDKNRTVDTCKANARTYPCTNAHHKSANAMLLRWNHSLAELGSNNNTVNVLFTGHKHCHVNNSGEHEENAVAGMAYYVSHRVTGVFVDNSSNRTLYEKLTALHEISHQLGARSNNSNADTPHHLDENGLGMCVMSYNRNHKKLLEYFDSSLLSDHRSLYCDGCYRAIINYLDTYY